MPGHLYAARTKLNQVMNKDTILEDLRAYRDAHAKAFGYDFDRIVADIRKHERQLKKEGWKFVRPKSTRPRARKKAA